MCEIIEFDSTMIRVKAFEYTGDENLMNRFCIVSDGIFTFIPMKNALYELDLGDVILEDTRSGDLYLWTKSLNEFKAVAKAHLNERTFIVSKRAIA